MNKNLQADLPQVQALVGRPVICLAASGGGHVRQLLDLESLWRDFPHFFVTEDTALGRSIASREETEFVPHFALGQARLGSPLRMLVAAWRSIWRSLSIIWRRRPDLVITTGAGSQLFIIAWARLMGARIVLIDSFARFDAPSAFARLAGPLAHKRYAQSTASGEKWPGAEVHDPLRPLPGIAPEKQDLVFATVGATLPFERLTDFVIEAKRDGTIGEKVVLQVGEGASPPPEVDGLSVIETMDFGAVQDLLARARMVICHGGTGSIITALRNHCTTIVIPRRFELGEHYDNHQSEITDAFAARGLVLAAPDREAFRNALQAAAAFVPQAVSTDYSNLIASLRRYIDRMDK